MDDTVEKNPNQQTQIFWPCNQDGQVSPLYGRVEGNRAKENVLANVGWTMLQKTVNAVAGILCYTTYTANRQYWRSCITACFGITLTTTRRRTNGLGLGLVVRCIVKCDPTWTVNTESLFASIHCKTHLFGHWKCGKLWPLCLSCTSPNFPPYLLKFPCIR